MKLSWIALVFFTFTATAHANIEIFGTHCGTRGTLLGSIASAFVIPDYFPPENFLLRALLPTLLFTDIKECEEDFSRAHLGQSCVEHDQCYATLGADKDSCDNTLLLGWLDECEQTFARAGGEECLNACELMTNIMYAGLRFQRGDFCPSCRAFERSQARAR